jgi:hypothetical protein
VSTKAERKRKAVKQAREGTAATTAFARRPERKRKARVGVENASFLPDETLRQLLVAGANAAGADTTGVFVFAYPAETAEDNAHLSEDRQELHLPVPPKGGDALQSATELFQRIVLGWSFIANVQHGGKNGYAEMCNDCLDAVVKEHRSLVEALAGAYRTQAA